MKLPAETQGGCPGAQRCSSSHRLYSVLDPSVARADQGRSKSKEEEILLYDTPRLLVATHEVQKTNPASASSGFWTSPPQPGEPDSSCPSETTAPFQALMPEPRTAQKAKVRVQLAAAGSPRGPERQIVVEGVKWVKNEQHK